MYMAHHQSLEEKSSKPNNNTNNINNNNIMVSSSSSTFCYSDVSPSNPTTIHPHLSNTHLHSNFDTNSEIYHLTSGLEMIGFQSKPLDDPSDPSKDSDFFHDHDHHRNNHHLMAVVAPGGRLVEDHHHHHHHNQVGLFMDESSLRTCVFPCEGNERPSQGLSLSLSSSNPSSIGLQSFELRNNHPHNQRFNLSSSSNNSRDGLLGKSQSFQQDEFFLGKSLQFEIVRNSKYMCPVQELLNEFCTLGTQQKQSMIKKKKMNKDNNWELLHDDQINNTNASSSSSSSSRNINTSLYGLSILELQKRKTKLFGMLEELDRRYKHYCDQLKVVESSYESVAGVDTANVYTTLASKAMSRHFRCLRDSLVAQIKATKKAMGQKNVTSTLQGTTMGETPRLRILDQTLRQQRAFQQMTSMESHPWRPQRGLPERSVSVLRAWLFEHFLHPYPSDVDKHILARQTCLTRSQVSNWFINARVRLWKPMVEQMYLEESKEQQKGSSSETTDHQPSDDHIDLLQDQKPDPDELVRLDSESLSSILNTTNNNPSTISTKILQNDNNALDSNNLQQSQPFGRTESFGYVALADFPSSSSSYNHNHTSPYVSTQNDNNTPHQGFGGGTSRGNNVSLTLGLQQHGGGNGVSLAFSPASQSSLFYGRDHIDDCQPVHHQYSLLNGDQGQNLPYRNLMDAQLLDDFAQ